MNLIPQKDRFLEENPFFSIEILDVMDKPLTTFEGCYILKIKPKSVNLHSIIISYTYFLPYKWDRFGSVCALEERKGTITLDKYAHECAIHFSQPIAAMIYSISMELPIDYLRNSVVASPIEMFEQLSYDISHYSPYVPITSDLKNANNDISDDSNLCKASPND